MCLPIVSALPAIGAGAGSAATAGNAVATLGIAQSVGGYIAQGLNAREQAKYQNKVYQQNAAIQNTNYLHQIAGIQNRQSQETMAAYQQAEGAALKTSAELGTAKAVLADRGVTGNSIDGLMDQFQQIDLNYQTNTEWLQSQFSEEMWNAYSGTRSNIASAMPTNVKGPDPFALAMGSAGAVLSGMTLKKQLEPPIPPR